MVFEMTSTCFVKYLLNISNLVCKTSLVPKIIKTGKFFERGLEKLALFNQSKNFLGFIQYLNYISFQF